jgi:hypothetical protein
VGFRGREGFLSPQNEMDVNLVELFKLLNYDFTQKTKFYTFERSLFYMHRVFERPLKSAWLKNCTTQITGGIDRYNPAIVIIALGLKR